MQKEKKAYLLYKDLEQRVSNTELKEIFAKLAKDEASHKLRFEIEYDKNLPLD